MHITIVGTGYVGLVTGSCFADVGNQVLCIDTDVDKIEGLNNGEIPIFEPGLDKMVMENISAGRLRFSTDIAEGVEHGEVLFIAVGTPPDEDGSADLQHILAVGRDIGQHIEDYKVVVNKSTVPVGTADKVTKVISQALAERGLDLDFSVVSNPEFLKEGAAIEDFLKPDRIVVGAQNGRALELMKRLYAPFNRNHDRLIVMDVRSAELTKYAANAMLATKISFMNEIANLAERLGADIEHVRQGIGSDPRIGYHFIYPGCGYGGSCFPKDVKALWRTAQDNDYEPRILEAVEAVNNDQKQVLVVKIRSHFNENLEGKKFAVWGLAFKPNTDDMREAPSQVIINALLTAGASVAAFDPVATEEAEKIYAENAHIDFHSQDPFDTLENADALVLVTEWKLFRSLDMREIKHNMRGDVIFDGRNLFDPVAAKDAGFTYFGIGRQAV